MSSKNIVHVAVAVIQNSSGEYLIAKRPQETHQGGLWEFPGGKVENNESILDALKREVFEEVNLTFNETEPLIQIHHNYGDKSVFLDVFLVKGITGDAFGKEGQEILWVSSDDLNQFDFPVANIPIIKAIQLPDKYMITGEFSDEEELLIKSSAALRKGIKLIQFRAHNLSEKNYFDYAKNLYALCERNSAKLILNTSPEKFKKHQAEIYSDGLHLTSKKIIDYFSGSISSGMLVSASIHNHEELLVAEKNKVDFAVLSPVNKTLSHPDSTPLGWEKFKKLTQKASMPIYALGGMSNSAISHAINHGGQGIAAIGEFWNK